jgi:putative protease
MGGTRFGARAYAQNPESEGLLEAIDYVHRHGKKLYLTVNTLLKEKELEELCQYLQPFYEAGLDAVLVQDLGVLRRIRQAFPDLPVHASTQMTVMDPDGIRALQDLGVTRVVTAREVTIPEMKAMADTGVEVEVFVHGAICYCYSGQCLLSSLIGGRSGNRGRCAQPCRLPYEALQEGRSLTGKEGGFVLNLKDMDTLTYLPDIVAAGVASLKIEGRMKSPRYTAGVTAVYRKYLDLVEKGGKYAVNPEDRRYLKELFDRGGYTEYASRGLRDGMVALDGKPDFRAQDEEFLTAWEKTLLHKPEKIHLLGQLKFQVGEPVSLTVRGTGAGSRGEDRKEDRKEPEVTATGPMVLQAENRPIEEEALRQRFSKLGDTEYEWEQLDIITDGQGFLPVGQLNELRRSAISLWEEKQLSAYRRGGEAKPCFEDQKREEAVPPKQLSLFASVDTKQQWELALSYPGIERIYLNASTLTEREEDEILRQLSEKEHPSIYLNLPPVLRASMKEKLKKRLPLYEKAHIDGYLIHTLDQAAWLRACLPQGVLWADASLYTFNKEAEKLLQDMGIQGVTLPVECNAKELKSRMSGAALPTEMIGYGYLTSMVSAQCVHRTTAGCDKTPGLIYLKDRKQKQFAVRNCCRYCFNVIYNSSPLYLLDCRKDWESYGLTAIRLTFTTETKEEMRQILDAGWAAVFQGEKVACPVPDYTRGHFRRGVE